MSDESKLISKGVTFLFGIYLMALLLVLLYILITIWPTNHPSHTGVDLIHLFGIQFEVNTELRYLFIAIASGALGGYIHLTTSFTDYVGNRTFVVSWLWWYLLRPFIGMALALMFYFTLRGGLIAPNGEASSLSPYGIAALTGLAGMFSKQATDKLKEVFENLFKTEKTPERDDPLKNPP